MRLALFLPVLLATTAIFFWGTGIAQETQKASEGSEVGVYLQAVDNLHDKSLEQQIEGWRRFLKDHPQSPYRDEIEGNLRNLEDLMANTDPQQIKEKRDTERYLRAVEYAKKLSPTDQLALWEQFLDENPQSIYRREATRNLEELRARPVPGTPVGTPSQPSSMSIPTAPTQPVVPQVEFKNPQTGILLATFPGLIVPGIGEWYSHDYTIGGVLTALRLGGLGLGIPGIINENYVLLTIGAALFGFSYIYDIVDAPYAVQRYNDALEQQKNVARGFSPSSDRLLVSYSFRF